MLCNPDKDGLQKYERLVLYPKILEVEKEKELLRLKETETSNVRSPTPMWVLLFFCLFPITK